MNVGRRSEMKWMLTALLTLAGCGGAGGERGAPADQALDGGYSLSNSSGAEDDKIMAGDPCWRREKGGWHLSTGHCAEMLPARPMSGVFSAGFEEDSFFPGATTIPDANDGRRYRLHLEVDYARLTEI